MAINLFFVMELPVKIGAIGSDHSGILHEAKCPKNIFSLTIP
jgi:hypothetical protein